MGSSMRFLLSAASLAMVLAGCQSIETSMGDMGDVLSSEPTITGEVQWGFAARSGDVVFVALQEARGTLRSVEIVAAPGVKHVSFGLKASTADRTRCQAGGTCRYLAELRNGETVMATGFAYYTTSSHPVIEISPAGFAPETGDLPLKSGAQPNVQPVKTGNLQPLPKPVYQ
ncbi:hypothetical protein [uncultured Cohaesibacter sp.]|uniref:hypothetical protein n=1 Tax=uncultured Cohaesibacter sp. TaxID=1002546 RepID=UPI00292DD997|nr:hypothetical protein [uncultured Cohaesibacter sp.]